MENSKLVHFLRLLSKKDLIAFQKYVASPYFNERESLVALLVALENHCFKGKQENVAPSCPKESVYQTVYGDKPFNESTLKTAMSQLMGLLIDFLTFSQFREDKIAQNRYVLQRFNQLNESRFLPKYYQSALRSLEKSELPAADREYEKMVLEEELHEFRSRQPARTPTNHLAAAATYHGSAYLLRMLRYHLGRTNLAPNSPTGERENLDQAVLDYLATHINEQPTIVQVYFQLSEALLFPDDHGRFLDAKALLSASVGSLAWVEANELYTCALNFAARQLNHGQLDFLPIVFSLYEEMLDHGLLVNKGKISPWHFKNMVNVAMRLGKFDWAETFISEWQNKVSPDHARNAFHFNQAMLLYYQRDFEGAAKHFNRVLRDHKDIFYGLNARGYLIQIHFETGDIRSMEAQAHSFRMYLNRKKEVVPEKRRQYIAFLNHLRKLSGIPLHDKARLEKLRREILEKDRRGMGTAWLLGKIGERGQGAP